MDAIQPRVFLLIHILYLLIQLERKSCHTSIFSSIYNQLLLQVWKEKGGQRRKAWGHEEGEKQEGTEKRERKEKTVKRKRVKSKCIFRTLSVSSSANCCNYLTGALLMYQVANYFYFFPNILLHTLDYNFKSAVEADTSLQFKSKWCKNIKQCKLSINRLNYSRLMFASVPRKSL